MTRIFTAIRTQSSHRKTRSESSGNYTNAVMTVETPSSLWGRHFQLPQIYSNTAGACRGTHLPQTWERKPRYWMFAHPGAHKPSTCSSSSHIVFPHSSHISSCTLCLLPFLTLTFSQLLYILWLPVITNKQNLLRDDYIILILWWFGCFSSVNVVLQRRKNSHGCFRAQRLVGWPGMWSASVSLPKHWHSSRLS